MKRFADHAIEEGIGNPAAYVVMAMLALGASAARWKVERSLRQRRRAMLVVPKGQNSGKYKINVNWNQREPIKVQAQNITINTDDLDDPALTAELESHIA